MNTYPSGARSSSATREARQAVVDDLRELCAWYEWGSQPHYSVIAEALQDAADAVRVHAMSLEAAAVLIHVWGHFVGREAAVGNALPSYEQNERIAAIRYAVADLTKMLEAAPEAEKPRLAKLLREQLSILDKQKKELKWPT